MIHQKCLDVQKLCEWHPSGLPFLDSKSPEHKGKRFYAAVLPFEHSSMAADQALTRACPRQSALVILQKTVYGANVVIFEGILAFTSKELLEVSE